MPIKLKITLRLPDQLSSYELIFDQLQITLGRDRISDIKLPFENISRKHAIIFFENSQWFIEDLGSKHGTTVQNLQLEVGRRQVLHPNDRICMVNVSLVVEMSSGQKMPAFTSEATAFMARRMVQEVQCGVYLLFLNSERAGERIYLAENSHELIDYAAFRRDWAGVSVEDMGGGSGIRVNDLAINASFQLKHGDHIEFGLICLSYVDEAEIVVPRSEELPPTTQFLPELPPASTHTISPRFNRDEIAMLGVSGAILVGLVGGLVYLFY